MSATPHPHGVRRALDLQLGRDAYDLLTAVRCPACRARLFAHMRDGVPRFWCACDEARAARRAAAAAAAVPDLPCAVIDTRDAVAAAHS